MEEQKKSAMATAGLILGIIGICTSFIPIVNNASIVLGVLAFGFGLISVLKKEGGNAVAGLVLGVLAVVITLYMQYLFTSAVDRVLNEIKDVLNGINDVLNGITGNISEIREVFEY